MLNIGICKLYTKLNFPSYVIKIYFLVPILGVISILLPSILPVIFSVLSFLVALVASWYYFKAVGMSSWWAIVPLSGIIPIIGIVGIISFYIAFIISNIRLGKMFQKSKFFIVGLALFPFIFQPILGYSNDSIS